MTEAPAIPWYLHRDHEFDPAAATAHLRTGEGITRVTAPFGAEAWLVTRLADVREVLGDSSRFSNVIPPERVTDGASPPPTPQETAAVRAGNLLAFDPPDHTRLRRMLTPAFTVRQIRQLEPRIEAIVEHQLDLMAQAGPPADLVAAFALPVPSLVICELLGVPYQDRGEFQALSGRLLDLSLPLLERRRAFRASREYLAGLADRALADPGPELLGALVRAHGSDLSREELTGIGNLLLIAGHETTANMLGLGTLALLRHPDQLELVRDQPGQADRAVEELLRWLSIVGSTFTRIAVVPTEVAGQRIEAGDLILASLPAANRDPGLVDDPDVLDVTRGAIGHLAFGHGAHHCLGAPLARAELRIAFPALLRRFPGLRLADPHARVELRASSFVYGVSELPVTW